ncbi:hypothetical protein DFJ73DRAFT_858184 [Zopfochytrium polystomum]|nr:hypothetical protein DFJ73DRAFT_858184 [Zopfochytrium polystomum]
MPENKTSTRQLRSAQRRAKANPNHEDGDADNVPAAVSHTEQATTTKTKPAAAKRVAKVKPKNVKSAVADEEAGDGKDGAGEDAADIKKKGPLLSAPAAAGARRAAGRRAAKSEEEANEVTEEKEEKEVKEKEGRGSAKMKRAPEEATTTGVPHSAAAFKKMWEKKRKPELEKEVMERGLDVKGTRAHLIAAILDDEETKHRAQHANDDLDPTTTIDIVQPPSPPPQPVVAVEEGRKKKKVTFAIEQGASSQDESAAIATPAVEPGLNVHFEATATDAGPSAGPSAAAAGPSSGTMQGKRRRFRFYCAIGASMFETETATAPGICVLHRMTIGVVSVSDGSFVPLQVEPVRAPFPDGFADNSVCKSCVAWNASGGAGGRPLCIEPPAAIFEEKTPKRRRKREMVNDLLRVAPRDPVKLSPGKLIAKIRKDDNRVGAHTVTAMHRRRKAAREEQMAQWRRARMAEDPTFMADTPDSSVAKILPTEVEQCGSDETEHESAEEEEEEESDVDDLPPPAAAAAAALKEPTTYRQRLLKERGNDLFLVHRDPVRLSPGKRIAKIREDENRASAHTVIAMQKRRKAAREEEAAQWRRVRMAEDPARFMADTPDKSAAAKFPSSSSSSSATTETEMEAEGAA